MVLHLAALRWSYYTLILPSAHTVHISHAYKTDFCGLGRCWSVKVMVNRIYSATIAICIELSVYLVIAIKAVQSHTIWWRMDLRRLWRSS